MSLPRLVLFDIDGTLLRVRREVGRRVLYDVFREVTGHPEPIALPDSYRLHGRTDRTIFRDIAAMIGMPSEDAANLFPAFEHALLTAWIAALNQQNVMILPGIIELLGRLENDSRVTLGLLTGNIERGARAKLAPHNLNRYFGFGAFGSDGFERNELPPIALERANRLNANTFSFDDAVIIGDSHRDIECARAWGIRSLAVATGGPTADELREHRPDALMETLEDDDAVLAFIHG